MQIVIIEETEDDRAMLARMLQEAGHEVTLAECAADGIAKLQQTDAEVLITEILIAGMGGLGGLEVIKAIRHSRPELWIISVSAGDKQLSAATALALARAFGSDRVLYKPFHKSELLAAIQRQ